MAVARCVTLSWEKQRQKQRAAVKLHYNHLSRYHPSRIGSAASQQDGYLYREKRLRVGREVG